MYTILLPTDGSELANNALEQALSFARSLNAKVIGLHVVREFHMPIDEGEFLPPSETLKRRADDEHSKHAEQILAVVAAESKRAGVDCECVVAINDNVHQEIVDSAARRHCDLIIMASGAHTGVVGLLLGSQTAKVLANTKLPVLVLH